MSARTMKRDLDVNPTLPEEKVGGSKDLARISIRTNISINPSNPDEIFLSGNWRNCLSTDGGLTWEYHGTAGYEATDPNPELVGEFCGYCEPRLAQLPDKTSVSKEQMDTYTCRS